MAMRSGQVAELNVPQSAFKDAARLVRSMKARDGLQYGETSPIDVSQAATAFGLYSQCGAGHTPAHRVCNRCPREDEDNHAEARGSNTWSTAGLTKNNYVYNLFATIFLHTAEVKSGTLGTAKCARQVILSQVTEGDKRAVGGTAEDLRAAEGGRLFQTSINTLTLEIYYRYFPPYKIDAETAP